MWAGDESGMQGSLGTGGQRDSRVVTGGMSGFPLERGGSSRKWWGGGCFKQQWGLLFLTCSVHSGLTVGRGDGVAVALRDTRAFIAGETPVVSWIRWFVSWVLEGHGASRVA